MSSFVLEDSLALYVCLYLQGEIESAEKYAEIARESDSYNPAAFVNLGNCHFKKDDLEKAKVKPHNKC